MASLSIDEYVELIRKSGLISADDVDSATNDFSQTTAVGGGDSATFAAYLEGQGLLTRWHNDKLLNRKYKGFFLGSYKFLDKIGAGGMGKVYLAEHTGLHRRSAIKILPRSLTKDTSHLDRFRLEARALAQLDHKNIVKVYDIGEERDLPYIVMEYVEGQNLEVLVAEQGPLTAARAAHFIGQAAAGLSHAHSRNMIHRDVKPSNLLLDKSNTIKVLDLGLARLTDEDTSLTQQFSDHTLGTTDYIAPEQAVDCHSADARSDLYSLGCTLYFLLTGHPPFNQGNVTVRLLAHQSQSPPAIREERAKAGVAPVEADLIAICTDMMAKNPDDRPQTARDVFETLSNWLKSRRTNVQTSRSHLSAVRALEASQAATETPQPSTTKGTQPAETDASTTADPLFSDDWTGRDTVASQATTPTVVNSPGVSPSDIFSQSSIYSSSMIGAGSSPLMQRAQVESRNIFEQYLWAWVAGGGVVALLIIGLIMLMVFSRGERTETEAAAGGDVAAEQEQEAAAVIAAQPPEQPVEQEIRPGAVTKRPNAQLAIAGRLLINLDSEQLRGDEKRWPNRGELGDVFLIQEEHKVKTETVGGVQAVQLQSDFYVGPPAPPEICGGDDRSIEVWALNSELSNREIIISWGRSSRHRDEKFGAALAFGYGGERWRSAVVHGASRNLSWFPDKDISPGQPNAPAVGIWHHLTYTYSGAQQADGTGHARVYVDGKQTNVREVAIETTRGTNMLLGAAPALLGQTRISTSDRATIALAIVRVHSEALTEQQIEQNFRAEAARFSRDAE
jgi:serine/threonine protein kinase